MQRPLRAPEREQRKGAELGGQLFAQRRGLRIAIGKLAADAGKKRDPAFTCANMFWWYNMASSADYAVTPRPIYKADWIGQARTNVGSYRDYLSHILGFERFRASQFGIHRP